MGCKGWFGFDLDGTTAVYEGWKGPGHIGNPIPRTVERIKRLLSAGQTVKIVTARVCSKQTSEDRELAHIAIRAWTKEHIGQELEATAEKDWDMIELYDDRAIQVELNTGKLIIEEGLGDAY